MRSRVDRYAPIYYDYFYLPNGHCRLDEKLADAISDSDFTTAFLSPGYAASPWCAFEWGYASGLSRAAGERVHAVLPILWKQPVEIRSGWRAIDIVRSIERKKYDEALEVAVQETLEFLDRRYG
jgi:hypothetical protein